MSDVPSSASLVCIDEESIATQRMHQAELSLQESKRALDGVVIQTLSGVAYTVPYTVKVVCDATTVPLLQSILDRCFEHIHTVLNHFNPDSEISLINRSRSTEQTFTMSDTLSTVLRAAINVTSITNGAFDVGVLPLLETLKSYVGTHGALPDENSDSFRELQAIRSYCTVEDSFFIHWDTKTIRKKAPHAQIDFGSCSKGYGVDCIIRDFEKNGFLNALVEWGGDTRAIGQPSPGTYWHVSVIRPPPLQALHSASVLTSVHNAPKLYVTTLHDEALATSGDYTQFLGNTRYIPCVVLQPPASAKCFELIEPTLENVAQVTVKCRSCLDADLLSTAAFLLRTCSQARIFLEKKSGLVRRVLDFSIYTRLSEGLTRMKNIFSEDPSYRTQRLADCTPIKLIVVGSGLAGMCAAIEAASCGAKVFILEKAHRVGGNSSKATSGINAWGSEAQDKLQIFDSSDAFAEDTYRSGRGGSVNKHLVEMLSIKAPAAIHWLVDQMNLPLSVVSQLGGHQVPRTHRFPDSSTGDVVPVGWRILRTLENYIQTHLKDQVTILTNSEVIELISAPREYANKDTIPTVTGVRYRNDLHCTDSELEMMADAVILTTGGFANDRSAHGSLLNEFVPHLVRTATTNGSFATGDGIKMARSLGAGLVDMQHVQLHPTGFIDPKNPMAPTKYLGPEALRGAGGILLNNKGARFVNELDLRSVVSQSILDQTMSYPLEDQNSICEHGMFFCYCVLNEDAAKLFGLRALAFYHENIGLFQLVKGVSQLAHVIGCDVAVLQQTLNAYALSSQRGFCDATSKKTFPVVFDSHHVTEEALFYVAAVTPVLHYCMGGLRISASAEVLFEQSSEDTSDLGMSRPIPNLFAAGETTGGVHGANRLGGNSLLECVVFGRIAGDRAATIAQRRPSALSQDKWCVVHVRDIDHEGDCGKGISVIRFQFPGAQQVSGLHLGEYVAIRGDFEGRSLTANFSPISLPEERGTLAILCRVDRGALKDWLLSLRPGDPVEMIARGGLSIRRDPNQGSFSLVTGANTKSIRQVVLLAGGTGIAPMIQIMQATMHPKYYANFEQIILFYSAERIEEFSYFPWLTALPAKYPKIRCHFILNKPPKDWVHGVGYITRDLLYKHIPPPTTINPLILVCGPPVMQNILWKHLVEGLKYEEGNVKFIDGTEKDLCVNASQSKL